MPHQAAMHCAAYLCPGCAGADKSVAGFTSDPDGPWSIDRLKRDIPYNIRGKTVCEDCVDKADKVIPLLSLKGE